MPDSHGFTNFGFTDPQLLRLPDMIRKARLAVRPHRRTDCDQLLYLRRHSHPAISGFDCFPIMPLSVRAHSNNVELSITETQPAS